jgi:hypothetical protein
MKYRTDFVTNSSSSSSVVICLEAKESTVHRIHYDLEFSTEGFNVTGESYEAIMFNLVNSEMLSLITSKGLENYKGKKVMVELSGCNDIYVDESEIIEFIKAKKYEGFEKLIELARCQKKLVNTYEEFLAHPYWKIVGINSPEKILKIQEELTIDYGDGRTKDETKIDLKKLRKQVVTEEESEEDE